MEEVFESNATPNVVPFLPPSTPSRSPAKSGSVRLRQSPAKLRRTAVTSKQSTELAAICNDGSTSVAERELAVRVADAADKIRAWATEIEGWRWSGSFEMSISMDAGAGFVPDDAEPETEELYELEDVEYWGSLPSTLVQRYEDRLDTIYEELSRLEVDDIKEKVLGIYTARSRPSSVYSSISLSNLTFIDDTSLFITGTLIDVLPHFAELRRYLRTWSIRLEVLKLVPLYLNQLHDGQEGLLSAWRDLDHTANICQAQKYDYVEMESLLRETRTELRDVIILAGQRLDGMLDLLETQVDTLPDRWIDEFESLELGFSKWMADADNRILELRLAAIGVFPTNPALDASNVESVEPKVDEPLVNEETRVDSMLPTDTKLLIDPDVPIVKVSDGNDEDSTNNQLPEGEPLIKGVNVVKRLPTENYGELGQDVGGANSLKYALR